jgi:hypothetical protein
VSGEAAARQVTAESRQAALLLHTLTPADREWLLARLSDAERLALEPLLEELRALGIPADRELLGEVIPAPGEAATPEAAPGRPAATTGPETTGPEEAAHLRSLERADPVGLAAVLCDEPSGLIVHLLRMREWPWRQALIEQLGGRGKEVEELLQRAASAGESSGPVPTALQLHLVTAVARRLREAREVRRAWRPWPWGRRPVATAVELKPLFRRISVLQRAARKGAGA